MNTTMIVLTTPKGSRYALPIEAIHTVWSIRGSVTVNGHEIRGDLGDFLVWLADRKAEDAVEACPRICEWQGHWDHPDTWTGRFPDMSTRPRDQEDDRRAEQEFKAIRDRLNRWGDNAPGDTLPGWVRAALVALARVEDDLTSIGHANHEGEEEKVQGYVEAAKTKLDQAQTYLTRGANAPSSKRADAAQFGPGPERTTP